MGIFFLHPFKSSACERRSEVVTSSVVFATTQAMWHYCVGLCEVNTSLLLYRQTPVLQMGMVVQYRIVSRIVKRIRLICIGILVEWPYWVKMCLVSWFLEACSVLTNSRHASNVLCLTHTCTPVVLYIMQRAFWFNKNTLDTFHASTQSCSASGKLPWLTRYLKDCVAWT